MIIENLIKANWRTGFYLIKGSGRACNPNLEDWPAVGWLHTQEVGSKQWRELE